MNDTEQLFASLKAGDRAVKVVCLIIVAFVVLIVVSASQACTDDDGLYHDLGYSFSENTVFLTDGQDLPDCRFMIEHDLSNVQPTDAHELDLYELGCVNE